MKTYEELLAENEALVAQVEILREIYYLADGARVEHSEGNAGEEKDWLNKLYSVAGDYMQPTPQQCLADIKAEAGRAGYLAATYDYEHLFEIECKLTPEQAANQYAAKIRNTGTWLKDSNVNGGKRQGGE